MNLLVRFTSEDAASWNQMFCERRGNKKGAAWERVFGWPQEVHVPKATASAKTSTLGPSSQTSRPRAETNSEKKTFESVWSSLAVRKTKTLKYACVGDFLRILNTGDAKRKRNHLDSWKTQWPQKYFKSWKASDIKDFPEFSAKHGGLMPLAFQLYSVWLVLHIVWRFEVTWISHARPIGITQKEDFRQPRPATRGIEEKSLRHAGMDESRRACLRIPAPIQRKVVCDMVPSLLDVCPHCVLAPPCTRIAGRRTHHGDIGCFCELARVLISRGRVLALSLKLRGRAGRACGSLRFQGCACTWARALL